MWRYINGPEDSETLWIECDGCKKWMHASCGSVAEDKVTDVFMCPA